jgi:ankyrin repeat protein
MDWICTPQVTPALSLDEKTRHESQNAIKSIPAYVERSDFTIILAPVCHHVNRKVTTCYKTWRRRGWCVMELFSAFLSRQSNPALLITSAFGIPQWNSPAEFVKLSVGNSNFSCCQRNHIGTDKGKISCDKLLAAHILKQLLRKRVQFLFQEAKRFTFARLHVCLTWRFMLHLEISSSLSSSSSSSSSSSLSSSLSSSSSITQKEEEKDSVKDLKVKLMWDLSSDTGDWFDSCGMSLLFYAVLANQENAVRSLLSILRKDNISSSEFNQRLCYGTPKREYVAFSIPKHSTTLHIAMLNGNVNIAQMLLECGADPKAKDFAGNDPFFSSCVFGHTRSLEYWMKRFSTYDLNSRNSLFGGCPLSTSVYLGRSKFESTKFLLDSGADVRMRTDAGRSVLVAACTNPDSNPDIVKLILHHLRNSCESVEEFVRFVNLGCNPITLKWKTIHFVSKCLFRVFEANSSGYVSSIALNSGATPLHCAVNRGDFEIVKLLLDAGADALVKNSLGQDCFHLCEMYGPFPEVEDLLLTSVDTMTLQAKVGVQRVESILARRSSRLAGSNADLNGSYYYCTDNDL